jgi:hypothetical protein
MKMRTTMIAALAAAQLTAAACPARAADLSGPEAPVQQARFDARAGMNLDDSGAPEVEQAESARADEPRKKKRKSTGDKVLTGAAVVLGIGALAVGGLLVAIFVN